MITFNKIRYDKDQGKTYCDICGELFQENTNLYIYQENYGVICESCKGRFSIEQIEEFLGLINTFGGHFGIYKSNQNTLVQILDIFLNHNLLNCNVDVIESNIKLRHKALLYGFTPLELIEEMKKFTNK